MESDKLLSGAAQVIPEGFVDIIRRVTPAVIFWIVIYFVTGLPQIPIEWVNGGGFLLFLLVSYATGLLIDALTDWALHGVVIWISWRRLEPKEDDDKAKMARVLNLDPKDVTRPGGAHACRNWSMPSRLRAYVREMNPQAAIVVPKLVAEEFLLRNIAGGMFLVLVMMFVMWLLVYFRVLSSMPKPIGEHPWALCGLVVACMLLAFAASLYRTKRTLIRTLEWLELVDASKRASPRFE